MKNITKDRLILALINLTQDKSLDDITISELTKTAKINRGTFYLSYEDFNDFIISLENNILDDLKILLNNNFINCGLGEGIEVIFKYIYNNMSLLKVCFTEELFIIKFEEVIERFIERHNNFTHVIPSEYSRVLLLNSTVSLLKIWIFESQSRSVNDIMEIFYKTRRMSPLDLVVSYNN